MTRASSGRGWARSAATTAALSCWRRSSGSACSIARRASSWRNARLSARTSITPASSASASSSSAAPSSSVARSRLTCAGTTDSWSSASRVDGPSRPTRARTASITLTGTASPGEASASVTKNGLPPVTRCSVSGVGAGAVAHPRHGGARERRERDPVDRAAGERAEEAVQRMVRVDLVVAEREHEHGADRTRSVAPRSRARRASRRRPSGRPRPRARSACWPRARPAARRTDRAPGRCRARRRAAGRACATPSGHRTRTAAGERRPAPRRRTRGPGSSCRSRPRR